MRRPARQRETSVAIALLLSVLGSFGAAAAQTKLVANCREPAEAKGVPQATLACDVRASGFAVMKDVKAALKGKSDGLEARFEAYDPAEQGTTTAYLIQLIPTSRRTTLSQMGDAVVTFTDQRQGKRRFTAYTFANDLTVIADSGASKAEFVRQIIAVKPASATVQLYKAAAEAVEALAKESGDRKALVILGDGTSDDTGYGHDQVVTAARDAGVVIHVLGYYDDRAARPNFQKLSRLAEDTGGYAAEVKQGPGAARDFSKDIVTTRFVGEILENGGTLSVNLKGPAGAQTLVLSANLTDGQRLETEQKVEIPAPPQPSFETTFQREPEPPPEPGVLDWLADNAVLIGVLAALLGLGAFGAMRYGRGFLGQEEASATAGDAPATEADADLDELTSGSGAGELLRDAQGRPVVYGWLEMLDGNASRHPLRTTNVRVGRHRDNDICLQNDSISRRHAVLHYNADTRRFVITDLGGGNGVIVNRTKYKSRELNDGDMVELGEVRLRFRAETEFLA
ncbi:FHA domain-containing protein [Hyphomicrobium sp.]|uniref:FHA domain-containing protein n=1 Tax=Hyphomicrobium sp. TaxID=82 RepID=UPI0025BA472F|nr:FHA domain-containing protein [Hyphomicrobium sp.]MCC7251580.1 FHA domain-containing protein [Hyphomicrobium sp.]